jgi:membrane-associated phospholipid phosphatase
MRWRRVDVVLAAAGVVILATSALLARRGVYAWEATIFQAINGLPGSFRPLLWMLNQYGTIITIPLATVAALLFRKWRTAATLAVSGTAVYLLAKIIKEYVARGRPAALLDDVVERETFAPLSLGYPSGHAAVAWAITIVVIAYLGQPWRIVAIALAIIVPLCRMYVAAHLPLDLIGGAALGVTVASVVNMLLLPPSQELPARRARAQHGPT